MKKLIALFLIFTQVSYAGLPPTTTKGQTDTNPKTKFQFQTPHNQSTDLGGIKTLIETGNGNIVPDPGFEAATSGWTASGGATATANSTAKGTGAKGYDWDSSTGGQTLQSTLVTIPNGYQGKNGVASCNIKTVSGVSTHLFSVNDGSNDASTPVTIENSTTSFIETKVNFVFPSSGSLRIRLVSIAASSEPEIYIDDCSIKLADNIGTATQGMILLGTDTITTCSGSHSGAVSASTTFAAMNTGTPTGCTHTVTGTALAPTASGTMGFKFASLPAGNYRVEYEGLFRIRQVNAANTGFFRFTDGTTTAREQTQFTGTGSSNAGSSSISQTFTYTTPQTDKTWEVYSHGDGDASAQQYIYGTTTNQGTLRLWWSPTVDQQLVSSAQADYSGATYALTSSNTQGFGTPTAASCTHDRVGGNLLLNCNFISGGTTVVEARVNLPNGLLVADTTRVPNIQSVGILTNNESSGAIPNWYVLATPSTGYVTFSRTATSSTAFFTPNNASAMVNTGTKLTFTATIPIQGWSSNQRAPTLVGSVTSNSNNALLDTSVAFGGASEPSQCTSTPCTIYRQDSSSTITSVSRSATGTYTVNFASGKFSTPPICTVVSGQNNVKLSSTAVTTTAFGFVTQATAVDADSYNNVRCIGNR